MSSGPAIKLQTLIFHGLINMRRSSLRKASEENQKNYCCRYIVHDHALRWLLYQGRYMFRVGHALAQCPLSLHLKHTPLLSPVALTKVPPLTEELDCAPRLPPLDLELPELELITVLEALTVVVLVVARPLRPPPRPLPWPRACPLCVGTGSGSGAWAPGASSHLKNNTNMERSKPTLYDPNTNNTGMVIKYEPHYLMKSTTVHLWVP